MSRVITKELAEKIALKLKAQLLSSKGAHKIMGVFHNDILVAQFGIRHGSQKDQGHDHVQKSLKVSSRFAKELGICTKSHDEWVAQMIEKGIIVEENSP